MTSFPSHFGVAAPGPAKGAWRPLLRARLVGRAEPLFIDASGLRSAASLWSGAQVWAQLLRTHPETPCMVVRQAERLALLQLLVAALWDGRTLQIESPAAVPAPATVPGAWCLDGRQVLHDGQPVCRLDAGGWPDLAGPAHLSILDMLSFAPAEGDLAVRGQAASHGDLWLGWGAPLAHELSARPADVSPVLAPRSEVLANFDLASLATPHDLLNDALLPLLRCTEVWGRAALPTG